MDLEDELDDTLPVKILLEEYEGAIVPIIYCDDKKVLAKLDEELRSNGVEVVIKKNSLLIYTKLYTEEEMLYMDADDFNPGYSINTFF